MASARQVAAARRNIKKAQARSAQLRRKGYGKNGSSSFYGKGRAGRKAAKRSTYGRRRDGLSIAQRQRRQQRANKWKRRAAFTGSALAFSAGLYSQLTPQQQSKVRSGAKNMANRPAQAKRAYKVQRMVGGSRRRAAKSAAVFAFR